MEEYLGPFLVSSVSLDNVNQTYTHIQHQRGLTLLCQLHLPEALGLVVNVDKARSIEHTRLPRLWSPRVKTQGHSMGVISPLSSSS